MSRFLLKPFPKTYSAFFYYQITYLLISFEELFIYKGNWINLRNYKLKRNDWNHQLELTVSFPWSIIPKREYYLPISISFFYTRSSQFYISSFNFSASELLALNRKLNWNPMSSRNLFHSVFEWTKFLFKSSLGKSCVNKNVDNSAEEFVLPYYDILSNILPILSYFVSLLTKNYMLTYFYLF